MPTTRLPHDPSFENLKKQAKTLQKSVRDGDAESLAKVREFHPRAEEALADFSLSDAQLVTARSYGIASWPRLKEQLDVIASFSWAPRKTAFEDPVDEMIRLACLDYENDHVSRREQASRIFATHPEYARANLAAGVTVGDVATVSQMLRRAPGLAVTPCGPFRWEPLLYACYSRLSSKDPRHSTLEVARLLLAHGADPNAGFLWHGLNSPCTALTGAFGEGEFGPGNQPPHPRCLELARLLLDAGADPNDSQTLYNRHQGPKNDYLVLLFEYGLGKDKGGPWFKRMGERLPSPAALIAEEVWNAAKKNYFDRVKLLAEHGVDIDVPGVRDGRTPYEAAVRAGNVRIAEYLLARGAKKTAMTPEEEFACACAAGDAAQARALLRRDPGLLERLGTEGRAELLMRTAESGRHEGVRLLAELGVDLNAMTHNTAMHQAVWRGDLEMVKLLVSLGADPCIHEPSYNSTPLGWAVWNQQPAVAEYLFPMADVFDAVMLGRAERLRELLRADPAKAHARDGLGQTPLHWLNADVKRGPESIRLLLASGADVNARNAKGETVLDKMLAVGRNDLADLLRQHGATPRGD